MKRWNLYALLIGAFVVYMVMQSRLVLFAPRLVLYTEDIVTAPIGSLIDISGEVHSLSRVYINNEAIPIDEKGVFLQQIIAQEGVNTFNVKVQSRFSKEQMRIITIIGDSKD